ncbi:MAG TPA: ABC transporter permease [Edaphobacter sp.]|jgi:predicted permease|nr:ABC transporter permease [Edaphobacter sp.]
MESILQDIRYALRRLRKSPGFTLTAVLTLAFGIGATTAIFSIVEGVLLRPLPFPQQSRLVTLGDVLEGVKYGAEAPLVTAFGVRTYMRDTHAFESLGGYQPTAYEFSGAGDVAQIDATRLTASMFSVLGVSPLIGRTFTPQEDDTSQPVALLSYQSWRSRFNSDPHVLGRKILLDRKPYEIIGVMPREFEFPLLPGQLSRSELWVPMSLSQAELVQGAGNWAYSMVGRLKPGVTPEQAQQDAVAAAQEIMRNFPPALSARHIHPAAQQLDEVTVAEARPLLRMLSLAVVVVLFIACANLAGLLLVRVIRRRREISVRLALGASGAAVLRQFLIEALVISTTGGLLGLALAWATLHVSVSFLPETLPRVSSIALDGKVVGFALALAVLTGLLCGLLPAITAARTQINEALKEGGLTGTAGGGHARLRSSLVIMELAVALVMLTASGLLLRSYEQMRSVNLGFHTDHLLTASYHLPRRQYPDQTSIDTFNLAIRARLEQLPGVQAVGVTSLLPASDAAMLGTFTPEGYVPPKGAGLNLAWIPEVMGNYFDAQGIKIIRGRDFTAADRSDAPLVTIVNRTLAEHYWPGQDPIGKRLHRGPVQASLPWLTVVGEIGDVKQLAADLPTEEQFYFPSSQARADAGSFAPPNMRTGTGGTIVLRSQLPPEQMADSLRAIVRSIDPELPLTKVESMDHVIAEGQASRRFNTALVSAFAGAALLLALLGIYSVIAFSSALRTQEMAIRLALGSQRSSITKLILISGAKLGLAGCGIGVVAALFAAHLLRSLLFQVDPIDPAIIVLAAVSILILALAASIIPARRAAAVDPIVALRSQ